MKQTLIIPGKLPGMNQIISSAKNCVYNGGKNKFYQYSRDKRYFEDKIASLCLMQGLRRMERVKVSVTFRERKLSRDPDNIQAGIKFILDGIVKAGVLPDDNFSVIRQISYHYKTNANLDEIKVVLESTGQQQRKLFS